MASFKPHKVGVKLASIVSVAIGSLALMASPALADVSHAYSTTIGGTGSNALSGPTDVAVDQASHDIYVTDPGNHRVEKFDSSGNFILMFGAGVNQSTGADVCTASSGDTCGPGEPGIEPTQFTRPSYLAVDNSSGPSAGDVYVADTPMGGELPLNSAFIKKFDPTGALVSAWKEDGQTDGSDVVVRPGSLTGEFCPLSGVEGIDVNSAGTLYVNTLYTCESSEFGPLVEYQQDGTILITKPAINGAYAPGQQTPPASNGNAFKVDSAGNLYYVTTGYKSGNFDLGGFIVRKKDPSGGLDGPSVINSDSSSNITGLALDTSNDDLYMGKHGAVEHYSAACDPSVNPCDPLDTFGAANLADPHGISVDGGTDTVYVADSAADGIVAFTSTAPKVTTGSTSAPTQTTVTLHGHIDPAAHGDVTGCHFSYGFDRSYGLTVPCLPDPVTSSFTGPTDVSATIAGLSEGATGHYRLVAGNAIGSAAGSDQIFETTRTPTIDNANASNITATSVDLSAEINPHGLSTSYRVEYGTTTSYPESAPVPEGTLSGAITPQQVSVSVSNLIDTVYHYRVVATNADGTTVGLDHTFSFSHSTCPNENVRQQVGANNLPDCRAYELVSSSDANGTQLYPGGPNTGLASSPARFSYVGLWGAIPGSGGEPIDGYGDLYVSTRTGTGWVSRYIGLPARQVSLSGGPPLGPPGSASPADTGHSSEASEFVSGAGPGSNENNVLTDPGMNRFLVWNDGAVTDPVAPASNAPYVFGADGSLQDRWPTNLDAVPGGAQSLDCPRFPGTAATQGNDFMHCPGDVTASADLSHLVYVSGSNVLAPGGQLDPPGSVYDNDTAAGTVVVASKTPAGADIPAEPGDEAGDPLQIPAVSTDGSRILIAAGATGPCGQATCKNPPCPTDYIEHRCPMQPSHLYMRIGGTVTVDVSHGRAVTYVGDTPDLSKVYFTSAQSLSADDTDSSVDLYMWSEADDSITLLSIGTGSAGNSDDCASNWTTACDVATYSQASICGVNNRWGGNCHSDNAIASRNGDIYFYSPEQLVGSRGIPNKANLYDYRDGTLQYVTTFNPPRRDCESGLATAKENFSRICADGPVSRMQVTPDDTRMAFLTRKRVTSYDNQGFLEMYIYNPASGDVICVSCKPDGSPPTSEVRASQDGIFMADDGRVFFSTNDPLVVTDTDHGIDIYEYVDGRSQLITPGTGDTREGGAASTLFEPQHFSGLVGVSADGTDVYFSTYQTLVPQDHNGVFIKYYDARSGGGFPAPPPPPGCVAADECHGPGTSAPALPAQGTTATLVGGNAVSPRKVKAHHRKAKRHKRRRARSANSNARSRR